SPPSSPAPTSGGSLPPTAESSSLAASPGGSSSTDSGPTDTTSSERASVSPVSASSCTHLAWPGDSTNSTSSRCGILLDSASPRSCPWTKATWFQGVQQRR